jgi:tetratricopeptide (TPR) repeat protein
MIRLSRWRGLAALTAVVIIAAAAFVWQRRGDGGLPLMGRQAGREGPSSVADVPLPDLSRLDAAVQSQIRQQHAALVAATGTAASPTDRAEAFGAFGKLLMAAEYFREAEPAFTNAEALAPADMRWPYYLGHLYRLMQEPARAIEAFERVLTLDPNHAPSLIWLGELHLASGNAADAEAYLQRAVDLQPDSAAARSRLGRAALERKDYSRAIEQLQHALRLDADASSVHYPLGMAYRGAGQLAQAEAHLQRGTTKTEIAPADPLMDAVQGLLQNARAYEARGMEALDRRDWAAAVENLREAVRLSPDNAVARLNLGNALTLAGDSTAAREELLAAVRLSPQLAKAHFALGVLADEAGQWDEARQRFSTAIEHDPAFIDAHFLLAEGLRRHGRAEQSLPHYTRVLDIDGGASQARFGYAMALVRLGRYQAAGDWLAQAVKLHPDQPGFPHALARVLAAAPDAAARDGRRALALMESLLETHQSLAASETMAMALAEVGRFDDAIAWQQRAIAAANDGGQPAVAARMADNLRLYQRGQPCRTPWRGDDPVIADR